MENNKISDFEKHLETQTIVDIDIENEASEKIKNMIDNLYPDRFLEEL